LEDSKMSYYQVKKAAIREAAQNWKNSFVSCLWGPEEITEWQSRFEHLGRRYGLLRNFRKDGII